MSATDPDTIAMKFEPKDKRSFRKLVNNIYIKNIPEKYSDDDVKKLFGQYGNIKSLVLKKNEFGQYGFVCYDDPKGVNKEYGPECAIKAIEALSGKDLGDDHKLYVKHALNKSERDIEKKRETIRYKNSKKKCNLYVKNFPSKWPKE
jgi:polyadenylate-binding protein